jgi:hypothetical protein
MKKNIRPTINREWINDSAYGSYNIEMRPYTFKELRGLYGLGHRAMTKVLSLYLDEIGPKPGRYYSPRQVEIIFNYVGPPYTLVGVE